MKLNKLLIGALAVSLFAVSCKRDAIDRKDDSVKLTADQLVVPADFKFVTEKDLMVKVKVANPSYTGEKFRINIYLDVPATGTLAIAGITNADYEYTTTMRVPGDLPYIYIEKVDERGNKVYEKLKTDNFTATTFVNGTDNNTYVFTKLNSGMDCNTGCTNTYNNHTGNVTVTTGQIACITGTFNGDLTVTGNGIVKFCADGNIGDLTQDNSARVYILEDANLTINRMTFNNKSTKFFNWSDSLVTNMCVDVNNTTENHGRWYINCNLSIETNGKFNNFGKLFVSNNLDVTAKLVNYHAITVNGKLIGNSGSIIETYCNLTAKDNIEISGSLTNNTYLKTLKDFVLLSGGSVTLQNGALISAVNASLTDDINGTGANTSIIKVKSTTTINTGGNITGKINLCDSNGVETNNGSITSPAQTTCSGYIPTGTCNPEGFGALVIADADGDGIADLLDDYPYDYNRAFTQFYPCATTCSNICFEDLWPTMGDFDFNDLIIAFNVTKVFNAVNNVVDYKVKMKPRCLGAGYDNGFGFSLDNILPNEVLNVKGQVLSKGNLSIASNGTESGQAKAVIIAWDSPEPLLHRQGGSMFNTIPTNPHCQSDTAYIEVTFSAALDNSRVVFQEFNPFIYTNQRRGYEIHLADHKPTSLADVSLFGMGDDNSNPTAGKYYRNGNNLPWAIQVSENLDYPIEKTSILDAYNYFDDWAASGGSQYPNWFRNFGSFRNYNLIYEE
ncbi:MAG TPA: LruC domain-containing protein [Bacteroidia bacterium]|nr:LruC domain-containing protein [Bacteroidia bacterium]